MTLDAKIHAARMAARKFTRGCQVADQQDAEQTAVLAVLERSARGDVGTFSYWYTCAERKLLDGSRADARRARRDMDYSVRHYGNDVLTQHTQDAN